MREYIVKYCFSLKADTPEDIRQLVRETSPNLSELTIVDINPHDLKAGALWAARSNFEELHSTQLIWYVEKLEITSIKVID